MYDGMKAAVGQVCSTNPMCMSEISFHLMRLHSIPVSGFASELWRVVTIPEITPSQHIIDLDLSVNYRRDKASTDCSKQDSSWLLSVITVHDL